MKIFRSETQKEWLMLTAIVLLTFAAFHKLFLMPSNMALGETLGFFTFPIELIKLCWKQHRCIPFWDNATTCGATVLANPCFQIFYPLFYLSFLYENATTALRHDVIWHLVIAALSMYTLVRVMGGNRAGSLFAAAGFVFSLPTVGKVGGGTLCEIHAMAWTPLTLACVWKGLETRHFIYFVLGGICLATQILSANVYCFLFSAITVCFLFVFFFVMDRSRFSRLSLFFFAASFLLFFGLGIGLSAVQLFPMMEFKIYSSRSAIPLIDSEFLPQDYPPLSSVWEFFRTLQGRWVTPLFLGSAAISFFIRPRKSVFFLGIATLIFFVASRGPASPVDLYAFFYHTVPGMKSNDHPGKYLFMVYIGLSSMAGLGFSAFWKGAAGKLSRRWVLFLAGAACFVFIAGACWTVLEKMRTVEGNPALLPSLKKTTINTMMAQLAAKEGIDQIRFFSDHTAESFGYMALLYRYQLINFTYYSQKLKSYTPYDYLIYDYPYPKPYTPQDLFKILGILNTKYVLTRSGSEISRLPFLKSVYKQEGAEILENPYFLPRLFAAPKAILMIGEDKNKDFGAAESKMVAYHSEFDPSQVILIRGNSSFLEDYPDAVLGRFSAVVATQFKTRSPEGLPLFQEKCRKRGTPFLPLRYTITDHGRFGGSIPDMERTVWALDADSNTALSRLLRNLVQKKEKANPPFSFEEYSPQRVAIRFTLPAPGMFVAFSENYYPGWKAILDGNETPVYLSDAFVRGVYVEKSGEHTLVFRYQSIVFRLGAAISLLSLVAAGYWLLRLGKKN